jgi:HNH endonuclease
VLATFEREPELMDVVALHLLDRHFAPGLHDEVLEAVGLELGTAVASRRRDMSFRAAVLEAYLAECCVCGFSLRLVDGLIAVDAAHIRWHAHGGPDEVPNGLALCALHHRLFDHGAITVREDLRVRVARALAGSSARDLFQNLDGQPVQLPVDEQFYPSREHLRWHHAQVFQGQKGWLTRFSGLHERHLGRPRYRALRSLLGALEDGQLFWFADWPVAAVPRAGALVYTVWNRPGQLVYVGMAGRGETPAAQIRVDGSGRRTFGQMAMGLVP